MAIISLSSLLGALQLFSTLVHSAPISSPDNTQSVAAATSYWLPQIQKQGAPAFGKPGYQVYRNVKDFGARGDGVTDDTDAINAAISSGGRCGQGCDSQTTTPALVYVPPGVCKLIYHAAEYSLPSISCATAKTMLLTRFEYNRCGIKTNRTILLHAAYRRCYRYTYNQGCREFSRHGCNRRGCE